MDGEFYYFPAFFSDGSGSPYCSTQPVYKWNNLTSQWTVIQNIATDSANGVEMCAIVSATPYEIDGNYYLAYSRFYNYATSSYSQNTFIFKWNKNTKQFFYFNKIASISSFNSEPVWLNGKFYLAVINGYTGYYINFYAWDHSNQVFASTTTAAITISLSTGQEDVYNIHFFNLTENNNKTYLIINCYWSNINGYSTSTQSKIYVYNSVTNTFSKIQDLATTSMDSGVWYDSGTTYLFTAPYYNANAESGTQIPIMWKYDSFTNTFINHYSLSATTRRGWRINTFIAPISNNIYILLANYYTNTVGYSSQSFLYKWNTVTKQLDQNQLFQNNGIMALTSLKYYANRQDNVWLCSCQQYTGSSYVGINTFYDFKEITLAPTIYPTNIPTFNPTIIPTNNPTQIPTLVPSQVPSTIPTIVPTIIPTIIPTYLPTNQPTIIPTSLPTSLPTIIPTSIPTINPTKEPTTIPTNFPSKIPSYEPTLIPTKYPTTLAPSNLPSNQPTNIPSINPTNVPTLYPTLIPSNIPTFYPTPSPVDPFKNSDNVEIYQFEIEMSWTGNFLTNLNDPQQLNVYKHEILYQIELGIENAIISKIILDYNLNDIVLGIGGFDGIMNVTMLSKVNYGVDVTDEDCSSDIKTNMQSYFSSGGISVQVTSTLMVSDQNYGSLIGQSDGNNNNSFFSSYYMIIIIVVICLIACCIFLFCLYKRYTKHQITMLRVKSEISTNENPQSPKTTSLMGDTNEMENVMGTDKYNNNIQINENQLNMQDDLVMFLKQHKLIKLYPYLMKYELTLPVLLSAKEEYLHDFFTEIQLPSAQKMKLEYGLAKYKENDPNWKQHADEALQNTDTSMKNSNLLNVKGEDNNDNNNNNLIDDLNNNVVELQQVLNNILPEIGDEDNNMNNNNDIIGIKNTNDAMLYAEEDHSDDDGPNPMGRYQNEGNFND